MPRKFPPWQKNILRILAWSCAVAIVWAAWQNLASAQGAPGVVVVNDPEDTAFFGPVFTSLLKFDTRGLMEVLGKPQFAFPAFIVLNVIVFVETGLLIGFFLPGDSLLVITGLMCANEHCAWPLPLLLVTLSASAIIGDSVGYWIGYKTGPKIFSREKSFFFAKDHLLKAQAFYETHGGKTIILARFIPFLRTFAPVVAGVARMEYRQFFFFNIVGGIAWVFSMVLTGRFLLPLLNPLVSGLFNVEFHVENHIEKVVLIVVFLSILPGIYAWVKNKLKGKASTEPPAPTPTREEALVGK